MNGSALELVAGSPAVADGDAPDVLVIGVGNLLMGDEGVGVHILRTLESGPAIPGVQFLDGGTGGINLLECIGRAPVIVMIDATRDGPPAGTVTRLRPAEVADIPRGLSAHDFGLRDLFAAAALLGQFPVIHLYTISVETIHPMCLDLSPAVNAAMPPVADAVRRLLAELTAGGG